MARVRMHLAADIKEGVAFHKTIGGFCEHIAGVQLIDLPEVL